MNLKRFGSLAAIAGVVLLAFGGLGSLDGKRVMSEAAVRMGTSNLLPAGVASGGIMSQSIQAFGAGGRVGTGAEAPAVAVSGFGQVRVWMAAATASARRASAAASAAGRRALPASSFSQSTPQISARKTPVEVTYM